MSHFFSSFTPFLPFFLPVTVMVTIYVTCDMIELLYLITTGEIS